MYLTRGGTLNEANGSLRGSVLYGYYWTSLAYPSAMNAFSLDFNNASVLPSLNDVRWSGFTVRAGDTMLDVSSKFYKSERHDFFEQ